MKSVLKFIWSFFIVGIAAYGESVPIRAAPRTSAEDVGEHEYLRFPIHVVFAVCSRPYAFIVEVERFGVCRVGEVEDNLVSFCRYGIRRHCEHCRRYT